MGRMPSYFDSSYEDELLTKRDEKDPTGKRPQDPGCKLDQGKAPIRQGVIEYFPRALLAVAEVSAFGADKYTWGGWGPVDDGINRYGNAQERHAVKASIEGAVDSDSGLLHKAHECWNCLAALELLLREIEINQSLLKRGNHAQPT